MPGSWYGWTPVTDSDSHLEPQEILDRESERKAEIESRLKTESRDRSWATGAEDKIREYTGTTVSGGDPIKITALSCLTSICSAQVASSNPAALATMMIGFVLNVPGMAAVEIAKQPAKDNDGSYKAEYRFFRKGFVVPGQDRAI